MKMRFEPPRITLVGANTAAELTRYLVRLAEKLNVTLDSLADKSELEAVRAEIEVDREYIKRLCAVLSVAPPDDVSWKK